MDLLDPHQQTVLKEGQSYLPVTNQKEIPIELESIDTLGILHLLKSKKDKAYFSISLKIYRTELSIIAINSSLLSSVSFLLGSIFENILSNDFFFIPSPIKYELIVVLKSLWPSLC